MTLKLIEYKEDNHKFLPMVPEPIKLKLVEVVRHDFDYVLKNDCSNDLGKYVNVFV